MKRPLFPTLHPSVAPSVSHTPLSLFYILVLFVFFSCFFVFFFSFIFFSSTQPSLFCFCSRFFHGPGCCSDAEADSIFRMAENKSGISYRRSVVITPKATAQFNQFLPTKDKQSGYIPAPLRKKRAEQDSRRSWASLSYSEDEGVLTRYNTHCSHPSVEKSCQVILAI